VRLPDAEKTDEQVSLAMPAAPEYVRLARLTAAGLASRLGFTFDEIEDLRIAVDEMCSLLIGPVAQRGEIRLTFDIDGGALAIIGEIDSETVELEFAQLSKQILTAVVDEFQMTRNGGTATCRIVRRHRDA
jgi:serine/threonine-protein kinase RsbW